MLDPKSIKPDVRAETDKTRCWQEIGTWQLILSIAVIGGSDGEYAPTWLVRTRPVQGFPHEALHSDRVPDPGRRRDPSERKPVPVTQNTQGHLYLA
jgi:hypothetical protein